MEPRQDSVQVFSTFLRFEGDRAAGWSWDRRLQQSMTACLAAAAATQADRLWALYWHQRWQQRSHPWAEAHLFAYLQETCYWVARKLAQRMAQKPRPGDGLADLFQVAIARVPKLLHHFNPQYSDSLKKYAELEFENCLKDWLRVQQQVEICSDWALLYRLSRKRLVAALQRSGWNAQSMVPYILAWECFQELATVEPTPLNALKRPTVQTWQAIAAAYNAERLSRGGAAASCTPDQIEQWLLTCATAVRQFLKPELVSADTPPSASAASPLDSVYDANAVPLTWLLQQEEDTRRQEQISQLQAALTTALATLDPAASQLLARYYGDQLTQAEIATQLGLQQYQVSRQLERIRRSLLKKVAQWSQATLHISPTPPVVDAMSHSLEAWLRERGQRQPEDNRE